MNVFVYPDMLEIPIVAVNPSKASSATMLTNVSVVSVSNVPMDIVARADTAKIYAQRRPVDHVLFVMQVNVFAHWDMSEILMILARAAAYVDSVATMPTVDTQKFVSNWEKACVSASMPVPRFNVDPTLSALLMITGRPAFVRMDSLVTRAICKWAASRKEKCLIWKIDARRIKIVNEDLAAKLEA